MTEFIQAFLQLLLDAAPWLVIGLFIGGLFKTLLPARFLHKHLTRDGTGSIVKAAVLGAPLPLCSCGVIPAALGLRRAGASKSATTSFLVSTPETGVDSVFVTYALMGPFMAVARPVAALFSALTAGTLVSLFDADSSGTKKDSSFTSSQETTCCAGKKAQPCGTAPASSTSASHPAEPYSSSLLLVKAWQGIRYAFTDLLDNIAGWLFVGIVFAAAIKAFVPDDFLTQWGSGWLAMLVMLAAGIPMYVCASASTPIATGFLLAGVSPGAVLVYLLAGPATNMGTLGVINKEMGRRTLWLYLLGITLSALTAGWLIDFLVARWHIDISQQLQASGAHMPLAIQVLSAMLLIGLSLRGVWRRLAPKDKSCCAN